MSIRCDFVNVFLDASDHMCLTKLVVDKRENKSQISLEIVGRDFVNVFLDASDHMCLMVSVFKL